MLFLCFLLHSPLLFLSSAVAFTVIVVALCVASTFAVVFTFSLCSAVAVALARAFVVVGAPVLTFAFVIVFALARSPYLVA